MARPREFDHEAALNRAMSVFWSKGFAATSTNDLTEAMRIGRQSMYDSFGDKRTLYLEALALYHQQSVAKRIAVLCSRNTAFAGIEAMLISAAPADQMLRRKGCMGVASIVEFGSDAPDVEGLRKRSDPAFTRALTAAVERAKEQGDISSAVSTASAVRFILVVMQGLQVGARSGVTQKELHDTARLSLVALKAR
jgi:TetR/AcrR family transcriptional regulator, transcriptional repressor for nem operon